MPACGTGRGEICGSRKKVSRREGKTERNEIPQHTWPVGAWTSNICLCYARPLVGKQKSEISGSWRKPMPTPEGGTFGKDSGEKNLEEPATERRIE